MGVLELVGGVLSFWRYVTARWTKRDYKVFFMFLKPEGEVMTFWEGLLDRKILARFSEHNKKM